MTGAAVVVAPAAAVYATTKTTLIITTLDWLVQLGKARDWMVPLIYAMAIT